MDVKEFLADRHEAFLSLDEAVIRAYATKYGATLPTDPDVFWVAVHKARTALTSLPMAERSKSKAWLLERGLASMDNGDIR